MPEAPSIAKDRIDALNDAVFGVAMTLLVIDIRLPDDFHPTSAAQLLDALTELKSKFLVYLVTFFVVGLRWMGNTQLAVNRERVSIPFAKWTILHLFMISCMPFSTMMIGRYDQFAPAVWIYAANMILAALVSMRLSQIIASEDGRDFRHDEGFWALMIMLVSAALSIVISFHSPSMALLAYLLNFAQPWVHLIHARLAGSKQH